MNVRERVRSWSLLRRVRAAFLVYALVSFIAPAYQVAIAGWPETWLKAVVLAGLAALTGWWLCSWRLQSLARWVEPMEWLVPAGIIYASDDVSVGAGTIFVVMLYRTLFGRAWDALPRICYLEVALFVPGALRAHVDPDFAMVDPSIAVAAAAMTLLIVVLKTALAQHEQALARERVLAAGARAAATTTDRQQFNIVAVRTALDLAGGKPGIRATLSGDGLRPHVLAADDHDADGSVGADPHLQRMPAALMDALRGGEPIYLEGTQRGVLGVAADAPVSQGGLFLVPLLAGSRCLGTLTVTSPRPLRPEIRSILMTWAAQVASSLEGLGLHEELTRLAFHDSLTGLPNRALVHDRLQTALGACHADQHVAFMLVDLDGFKQVNDTYGHKAGDDLLCCVAERLTRYMRDGDTVGRLGGDEFAVILPGISGYRHAVEVAERLIGAIRAPITADGHVVSVGSSIGIAWTSGAPSSNVDDLIRAADTAMYQVKSTRQGGFATYDAAVSA